MSNNISLVTRTFQPKKDKNTFDVEKFKNKFVKPLKKIMQGNVFSKTYVVVNVEINNPYAEIKIDGISASHFYINQFFSEEINNNKIEVIDLEDWGQNAGSANALTTGLKAAHKEGVKYVMNWSPEMDFDGDFVKKGLDVIIEKDLFVVGYLRDFWWKKFQWLMVQNTASIWNVDKLISVNGFSKYCDSNPSTLYSEEYGEISLQGMEDFYSLLLLSNKYEDFKWAMIGSDNPITWTIDTDPNTENGLRNLKKIYRQSFVMKHYVSHIYDNADFDTVLANIFNKLIIL